MPLPSRRLAESAVSHVHVTRQVIAIGYGLSVLLSTDDNLQPAWHPPQRAFFCAMAANSVPGII